MSKNSFRVEVGKNRARAPCHYARIPSTARISGTCALLPIRTAKDLRKAAHVCQNLPMSERKVVGRAIKVIRKAQGITQDELAVESGISPSHLQRIETGQRQPMPDTLRLICIRLGISSEDITYEVETLVLVSNPEHANLMKSNRRVLVAA
jgi:DNA-binding transcriptional regulator YiaG